MANIVTDGMKPVVFTTDEAEARKRADKENRSLEIDDVPYTVEPRLALLIPTEGGAI